MNEMPWCLDCQPVKQPAFLTSSHTHTHIHIHVYVHTEMQTLSLCICIYFGEVIRKYWKGKICQINSTQLNPFLAPSFASYLPSSCSLSKWLQSFQMKQWKIVEDFQNKTSLDYIPWDISADVLFTSNCNKKRKQKLKKKSTKNFWYLIQEF